MTKTPPTKIPIPRTSSLRRFVPVVNQAHDKAVDDPCISALPEITETQKTPKTQTRKENLVAAGSPECDSTSVATAKEGIRGEIICMKLRDIILKHASKPNLFSSCYPNASFERQ